MVQCDQGLKLNKCLRIDRLYFYVEEKKNVELIVTGMTFKGKNCGYFAFV